MAEAAGQIVMLVGTSSAGKSTTAAALQCSLGEHHLLLGFDLVLKLVDDRWGGHGPYTREGFRYDPSTVDEAGEVITTISCGPVGQQVLRGTHRAVAALARSGVNVIVDEMLLNESVLADWWTALEGLSVWVVQVRAPVEVLIARERERSNRNGLALGHLAANTLTSYDVAVDTSVLDPSECAARIAAVVGSSR